MTEIKKEPYSPKALSDFIHRCRTVEGGIPHFIPKYGDAYLTEDLKVFDVLGTCWGGEPESPVGSVMLTNVPHELVDEIKERKKDYVWLIKKFGTKKQVEESLIAPIFHERYPPRAVVLKSKSTTNH